MQSGDHLTATMNMAADVENHVLDLGRPGSQEVGPHHIFDIEVVGRIVHRRHLHCPADDGILDQQVRYAQIAAAALAQAIDNRLSESDGVQAMRFPIVAGDVFVELLAGAIDCVWHHVHILGDGTIRVPLGKAVHRLATGPHHATYLLDPR